MVKIVDTEKWAPYVARFLLAFGSIESSVNNLLQQWCSLQTLLFLRTLTLENRVKLLRDLSGEHDFGPGNREALLLNLGDVTMVAKSRNLMAHNPLVLTIFDLPDATSQLTEVIQSECDTVKQITFEELSTLTNRAETLADVLMQNRVAIGMHGKTLCGQNGPYQAELERPSADVPRSPAWRNQFRS